MAMLLSNSVVHHEKQGLGTAELLLYHISYLKLVAKQYISNGKNF